MHIGQGTPNSLRQRIKQAQLKRIPIELTVGTRVGRDRLQCNHAMPPPRVKCKRHGPFLKRQKRIVTH